MVIAALLSGCGRVGFDTETVRGSDGSIDQAMPSADADLSALLTGCELGLRMNEATWTSGLVDSCGGDNGGTRTGTPTPVTDAERGRVGVFNGGTDCVVVSDAPGLRGGSAMTISAWVRPTELSPGSFGVVSKRTDFLVDTAYSVFVWSSSAGTGPVNHLYVDIDTEDDRFESPTDEFLNAWRQITMVYDGSRAMNQRCTSLGPS